MKSLNRIEGRIWLISDKNGNLINDIDTDQIFHNAHLHITDIDKMGEHTFGNLEGWKDFSSRCKENDIILAGKNFGAGSSRQQAVDCFRALGISAILAESFGAIYKRNAINSGFPVLIFKEAEEIIKSGKIRNLDEIDLEMTEGRLIPGRTGEEFLIEPLANVQKDILKRGTLLSI